MNILFHNLIWNYIAGCSPLFAFISSRVINKIYFGHLYIDLHDFILVLCILTTGFFIFFIRSISYNLRLLASKYWIVFGWLYWGYLVYFDITVLKYGLYSSLAIVVLCLLSSFIILRFASSYFWNKLRISSLIIPALVSVTPIVFGFFSSYPSSILQADSQTKSKITYIVLIFDELNYINSDGLVKILNSSGFHVNVKPITPTHLSTTQVIPELFFAGNFKNAAPCGFSRVCAENSVLDFSKVSVMRNDVDIVGFHHPYCAINNLRYCRRIVSTNSVTDLDRLHCSFYRRTGIGHQNSSSKCQTISHRQFERVRDQTIDALYRSPALQVGGVLFAHLPLPHPPGGHNGTLSDQYFSNIKISKDILKNLLLLSSQNSVHVNLIISSDHPLRQSLWCSREPVMFDSPCLVDPALNDKFVPLIVASKSNLPDINHIHYNNREIFNLLEKWINVNSIVSVQESPADLDK